MWEVFNYNELAPELENRNADYEHRSESSNKTHNILIEYIKHKNVK